MKRFFILLVAFFSVQQSALAAGYLTPYGVGTTIEKYLLHGEGGITLWVTGLANPDGCGANNLVHVPATLQAYKNLASAVMLAHAAGKKVGFYGSGCSTLPFWGGAVTYPVVSNIWVTD